MADNPGLGKLLSFTELYAQNQLGDVWNGF